MKDYKLKQRNLRASHNTYCWAPVLVKTLSKNKKIVKTRKGRKLKLQTYWGLDLVDRQARKERRLPNRLSFDRYSIAPPLLLRSGRGKLPLLYDDLEILRVLCPANTRILFYDNLSYSFYACAVTTDILRIQVYCSTTISLTSAASHTSVKSRWEEDGVHYRK
jgi:hypothetical protein